jgi:hypothetical protein
MDTHACWHPQSVVDAVEQKAHFDAQLDKATADAIEMKAAWDKVTCQDCSACAVGPVVFPTSLVVLSSCLDLQSVVDATEQKAQFDAQLDKATADASTMKAAYDKVRGHGSQQ